MTKKRKKGDTLKALEEARELFRNAQAAKLVEESGCIGHKDTKGKLPLNLVPPRAYRAIAKVREFGNAKYKSPWGWLASTTPEQYVEATRRHLLKIDLGEEYDDESNLPHLYHALCSLAMAVELYDRENERE